MRGAFRGLAEAAGGGRSGVRADVHDRRDFRVFVDIYATGPDIALGTGALWAFTRDAQIALGTYIGLNGAEPVATPFVGLSVRR